MTTLASNPNICGTKLSDANIGKLNRLCGSVNGSDQSFAVYAGKSDVFVNGLLGGSAGLIAALVNFAPKTHVRAWQLASRGDWEAAQKLQTILAHADWEIAKIGGVSGLKVAVTTYFGYGSSMLHDGRTVTVTRKPLASLGPEVLAKAQTRETLDLLKKIEDDTHMVAKL